MDPRGCGAPPDRRGGRSTGWSAIVSASFHGSNTEAVQLAIPESSTDLSKTHLIGEDTVDALLVQVAEPSETLELILLELGHEHFRLGDGERVLAERRVLKVELIAVD
jgi:hypothetical protein